MPTTYTPDGTAWIVNVPNPLGAVGAALGDPRSQLITARAYQRIADRLAYLQRTAPVAKAKNASGNPLSPTYNNTTGWSGGNDFGTNQVEPNSYCDFPGVSVGDQILVHTAANLSPGATFFVMAIDDAAGTPVPNVVPGTSSSSPFAATRFQASAVGVWTVAKAGTTRVGFGCNSSATVSVYEASTNATLFPRTAFDPTQSSLSGFWRDFPGSSPWTGVASAGASGGRTLTEATHPPTAGTALNGHGTASLDGINKQMASALALSSFLSASAWSAWALVNNAVPGGTPMSLLEDAGGFWGVAVANDNGSNALKVYPTSPALQDYAASTWSLIQAKYDGTYVWSRVNHGLWVPTPAANISNLTNVLQLGIASGLGINRFSGLVAEIGLSLSAQSDSWFEGLASYVNTRYALAI